ncbi:hypothetical protein JW756_04285 [Candidatus Woesearchaeota archaeon]|nr:hypothetical protein [Candidatus Woesearchaeota archaeon]
MVNNRKAQAAFEYLTTYGWAILTAVIAVGALAYFGFLSPKNLLPNTCDFGKQLECVEYQVISNGSVNLILRNNFGKDITITSVTGVEETVVSSSLNPDPLPSGQKGILTVLMNTPPTGGEKKNIDLVITFARAGGGYPAHNISGSVFTTVMDEG